MKRSPAAAVNTPETSIVPAAGDGALQLGSLAVNGPKQLVATATEIAVADEAFRSDFIEDAPGIDPRGDLKGYAGREVRFDDSGEDVDGGALGRDHEVNADGPCHRA